VRYVFIALTLVLLQSCAGIGSLLPGAQESGELGPPIAFSSASAERAINEYRQSHGLTTVRTDPAVVQVAQEQSDAMAKQNRMDHDAAGDFGMRTKAIRGVKSAAENIAYGHSDFPRTLKQWINSYGHNKNLLMKNGTRMGVAVASSAKGMPYWTFVIVE
jgi:uncharacterized protein YkwD